MKKHPLHELPIRSKVVMLKEIVEIIQLLHQGRRDEAEKLIKDLKIRATALDPQIQQDVLMFTEQIYFQYDYDPWHKVTPEVKKAADKLIEDLGFGLNN